MLTETYPPRQRIAGPVLWALTSGITGLLANVLLVLFFLLAKPFGVSGPLADDVRQDFMWLGTANDWVIVVQFLTFIPVALALRGWLPPTRSVRLATAAAVGAMLAVAILQLLLVAGVLEFDVQVLLVVATFLVVYTWVLTASSAGHRHGTLPRSVTRFGLLLGASYPVGMVIAAAGLLFPWGSAVQLAFVVPGVAVGSFGWLALPVWPLFLARRVFSKLSSHISNEEGTS
ncbi:MAG TPA: hypothetical protein VF086_05395 [Propionibacteriaceae bacterium]